MPGSMCPGEDGSWRYFHAERGGGIGAWSLPDLVAAAGPRASSGELSYHLGIFLPSSCLRSKIRHERREKQAQQIPSLSVTTELNSES